MVLELGLERSLVDDELVVLALAPDRDVLPLIKRVTERRSGREHRASGVLWLILMLLRGRKLSEPCN